MKNPFPKLNAKPKKSRAFTLLELLIATSLSSIVMVVLVGGFFMVSKNWEAQDLVLDKAIDNSLIRLEIEKAILGAFPYTYTETNKKIQIYFKGNDREVSFVSTMSPSYNNQLTIWIFKTIADGGLSIQVTSALTGDPAEVIARILSSKLSENEPTEVLSEYQASFEYLEETKSGEKNWLRSWDAYEKKSLPLAVRIELELIDNEDQDKSVDRILAFILANTHQSIKPAN
ncbi:MAG: prepilin-type N-terminal cleavage/methylation domain-containing protein [Pseudomonadota bacterium]